MFPNVKGSIWIRINFKHYFLSSIRTCSSRNSVEAKRKLINAEFELLKHCNPDKTLNELKESDINYLMTLDETKTERKFTLDVSYKLRRQTFERLSNLQVFDGHEHLMLPFIGSEVVYFISCFNYLTYELYLILRMKDC